MNAGETWSKTTSKIIIVLNSEDNACCVVEFYLTYSIPKNKQKKSKKDKRCILRHLINSQLKDISYCFFYKGEKINIFCVLKKGTSNNYF